MLSNLSFVEWQNGFKSPFKFFLARGPLHIGWDASTAGKTFVDPYEAKLAAAKAANPPAAALERPKLKKTPTKEAAAASAAASAGGGGAASSSSASSGRDASAVADDAAPAPVIIKIGAPSPASGAAGEVTIAPGSKVIAYAELRTMVAGSGLDMTQRESYLSDAEFKEISGWPGRSSVRWRCGRDRRRRRRLDSSK